MNLKRILICAALVVLSISVARAFILTSGNYHLVISPHSGGALSLTSGNYSLQDMKGLVFYASLGSGQYLIGPGKYVLHPEAVIPPPTIPPTVTTTTLPGVPPALPQAPVIGEIWFGNRLYQKEAVAKGEQFITTPAPRILINISATGTWGIDPNRVEIVKGANTYIATEIVSSTTYAAAPAVVQSLSVAFTPPATDQLEVGTTALTFRAYDATNAASTDEVASVTVIGGEPRVIGTPITFPSPLHLKTDTQVTFQYTLSHDINVQILLVDISGRVEKSIMRNAREDGGSAGVNKPTWDLITDRGERLASGTYVFIIRDRDTGKAIGRGKLTALP